MWTNQIKAELFLENKTKKSSSGLIIHLTCPPKSKNTKVTFTQIKEAIR